MRPTSEKPASPKAGIRIRLQEQPFQILVLLFEHPGQIVTREEIRQKLWSQDTFVEFDDALNTAVRKLRTALNDSADNPRFLETVPRKGYRFLAPISLPELQGDQSPAQSKVPATPAPPSEVPQSNASRQLRIALHRRAWIGIAALTLATIAGIYWSEPSGRPCGRTRGVSLRQLPTDHDYAARPVNIRLINRRQSDRDRYPLYLRKANKS